VDDFKKCASARAIIERVDWQCEILRNYSETNLGCKKRVSTGLDWVFENVKEAIILEDDCLPHPSFFIFCEELLERYRNDSRVSQIGGTNFQFGRKRNEYGYYFSRNHHIWGWATWRRAWANYDVDMFLWPEIRDDDWLLDWLGNDRLEKWWACMFEKVYKGEIDTWDFQWVFSNWVQGMLSVIPNVNMVSNIGFGPEATHTIRETREANMAIGPLIFPIMHPPFVLRDSKADDFTEQNFYLPPTWLERKIKRIKKIWFFCRNICLGPVKSFKNHL
jgi:hypothetical protein